MNTRRAQRQHDARTRAMLRSPKQAKSASVTRRDRPPLDGPILWRHRWPHEISSQLVSFDNPTGSINNSELELAGTLAGNAVLVGEADVAETTTATGTDNAAGHYLVLPATERCLVGRSYVYFCIFLFIFSYT